jgi:hypothetical protein
MIVGFTAAERRDAKFAFEVPDGFFGMAENAPIWIPLAGLLPALGAKTGPCSATWREARSYWILKPTSRRMAWPFATLSVWHSRISRMMLPQWRGAAFE